MATKKTGLDALASRQPEPELDVNAMTLEELRAEKERLEIQKLRIDLAREKAKIDARQRAVESQQQSLDEANALILAQQKVCRHKKGGKDMGGILAGDGIRGGYCIAQHTYATGDIGVHCTRCAKAWFNPGSLIQKACAPSEYAAQQNDSAEYARQLAAYKQALEWPTDNTPSGTQTHLIEQKRSRA